MNREILKNPVFTISAIIIIFLVILGAIMPQRFGEVSGDLFAFTTINFGWLYLFVVFFIIILLIGLAISRYGNIRIGREDERPVFPFFTWIGMLFSAGFGVGLVFWGVAEPMSHFFSPPFMGMDGLTEEAARVAMGYSFFHWGVSQWAIFAIVGLVIGFLQFRKERDGLISTALEPITGNKASIKNTIDILAVIATVMGIATSLGLGILQMNGGINVVLGTEYNLQLIIIVVLFLAYMYSTSTGLEKGIRYLSNLNLGLALGLLLFVLIMGPTVFILETFTLAFGDYLTNFIRYSLRMKPYVGGTWVHDWTIFYWAWAIAWSPFVGAFVARVSRGRTIREYVMGVMVIPPVIACFWIATFGGTALLHDLRYNAGIAEVVNADLTLALFQVYELFPLTGFLSVLSILLIFTFLVTSADSATYILASMTTRGSLNPKRFEKFVWGTLMAAIAGILLYAGGLQSLQTASLISALPFTIIIFLLMFSIIKLLKKEPLPIKKSDLRRFEQLQKKLNKDKKK